MALSINPFFSVPFATTQLDGAEPLCAELRELFLRREAEGERHRNAIRRDTQHGLFESKFDLHTWPDAPVQQLFGFIHHAVAGPNRVSEEDEENATRFTGGKST